MSTLTRDEKFQAEVEAAIAGVQLEAEHLLQLVREDRSDDAVLFKTNDVLEAVRHMLATMFQAVPDEVERDELVLDMMKEAARRAFSS